MLDEILARYNTLPEAEKKELEQLAIQATKHMTFIPNPGPQTMAYTSKADILLFGGSPGGGKTALEVGLALNEHHRSLVVRRQFVDLEGVLHTLANIVGSRDNLVGGNRPQYNKPDGGVIHFQGMGEDATDLGGKQGNPHDLICVDEAAQMTEDQVRMLIGWLRSDRPGQRTRMVLGSNPPLDSTGDWMVEFFGPWLNPAHPNPAGPGELRWYLPDPETGRDFECEEGDSIMLNGVQVFAHSRTYIPSSFTDNPFYSKEDYAKSLSMLPASVRDRLMSGNFLMARPDDEWQLIPTSWIQQAQDRWTQRPPEGVPQCAIGADIAQGGDDQTVLAVRYDGWFDELKVVPGKETPDGKKAAGKILEHRRDDSMVIVDLGGGWGGDCYGHLKENNIKCKGYMGVKTDTNARTKDNDLRFFNVRAEAYWKLREALDPSQEGGSRICLPRDSKLLQELTILRYEITSSGIKLTPKDKVKEQIGRSPDRADAVAMAWWQGPKQEHFQGGFKLLNARPRVILGRESARRRRT
jgi:hypothetical protein